MPRIPPLATYRARQLRRDATPHERILWRLLSPYRPRFTRQLPVGTYIIDIACREAKLAIELDGGQHGLTVDYDERRTAFLESKGWQVLRVWNGDVMANADGVAEMILRRVEVLTGIVPYRHERWRDVEG